VLGEHELASLHPAGAGLAELAQHGVDPARRVAVDGEAFDGVLEDVRNKGEHRPPVAGRACRRAGRRHRIDTFAEQEIIVAAHYLGGDLRAGNLAKHGHGVPF